MARHNRFVIMMTEKERQAVESLAKLEKLPASTLARKRLLTEAEQRGIVPVATNNNSDAEFSKARVAVAS